MSTDNEKAFLEWLEEEIEDNYSAECRNVSHRKDFCGGRKTAFIEIKEKFLILTSPT